jgi:hypothetical protein
MQVMTVKVDDLSALLIKDCHQIDALERNATMKRKTGLDLKRPVAATKGSVSCRAPSAVGIAPKRRAIDGLCMC